MKYVKFYSLGTLLFLATISSHFLVSMPVAAQPTTTFFQATPVVPSEDDEPVEPDDGSDQCRLAWPYCEAH
jgi:hypothetical protein